MSLAFAATDLSPASACAVTQARAWARARDARLTVLLVVPDLLVNRGINPQRYGQTYARTPAADAGAARALEEFLRPMIGSPGSKITLAVEHGVPHAEIVRTAESAGAGLIAVGAHGQSGGKRVMLGSVADRVVRHAHTAVLVARDTPGTGHVVVGTDFSPAADAAVAAAADEARQRRARLTVVHNVEWPPPEIWAAPQTYIPPPGMLSPEERKARHADAEAHVRDLLSTARITGDVHVTEGDSAGSLVRTAEELPAGLLVVAGVGRTGLARVFLGSVAETVARTAPCSVLVFRRP